MAAYMTLHCNIIESDDDTVTVKANRNQYTYKKSKHFESCCFVSNRNKTGKIVLQDDIAVGFFEKQDKVILYK